MNIEEINEKQLELLLRTLAPEFWKLYMYTKQTSTNPDWLCRIMRGIYNVKAGTGWGKVIIGVQNRDIYQVETTETDKA